MKEKLSRRRLRQGAMATAITLVVVAVLVLLNLVVGRMADRFGLRLDLTDDGVFTLSQNTLDFIGSLDREVEIFILNNEQNFTAEGTYLLQASETIKEYGRRSDRIKVEFVDLMRDPGFVSLYADLQPSVNTILVRSGDNVRLLSGDDLFNYQVDDYGYYITSNKTEQSITSAIAGVTSEQSIHAVILTGHSESEAEGLAQLLVLNNYQVSQVQLAAQELPADARLIVISAPLYDYTEEELTRLERFLYNDGAYGRTLFYLAGVDQPQLPALESFLARWGVAVGEGAVYETDYYNLSANNYFFTNALYAEDRYSRVVQRSGQPVSMINSRPLELLEAEGVETQVLLTFAATAGVRTVPLEDWSPSVEELGGQIPSLVLSTRTNPATGETGHLLTAGTSLAVAADTLATPVFANAKYFLSLLGELCGREDNIIIEAKLIGSPMLGISYGQALAWGLVFLLLLPLAVLVLGAVVFFRRRHL